MLACECQTIPVWPEPGLCEQGGQFQSGTQSLMRPVQGNHLIVGMSSLQHSFPFVKLVSKYQQFFTNVKEVLVNHTRITKKE